VEGVVEAGVRGIATGLGVPTRAVILALLGIEGDADVELVVVVVVIGTSSAREGVSGELAIAAAFLGVTGAEWHLRS